LQSASRNIGFPAPAMAFPFSGEPLRFFLRLPSPDSCEAGSSSRELLLPCRVPPIRIPFTPAVGEGAFLGVPSLFAASSGGVHIREAPTPHSVPLAAFHTPSVVYSASGLAGLFHPATTSRVLRSRGFPLDGAVPSRRRPVPSSLAPVHCKMVAHSAPQIDAPPSGLALHRDPL